MAANPIGQAIRRSSAMGPSVRNLLSQYKLDPGQIASTGPHKTLLKSDVLAYINQQQQQPPKQQQTKSDTAQRTHQGPLLLNKRYARTYPSQLEIDVINSGGLVD